MKSYAGWSKQQIENHRKQVRDRNKTPKYKEKRRQTKKDYRSRAREKFKQSCVEYKGGYCAICGLKDSCVEIYDFHHKDPKEKDFGISRMKNRANISGILCKSVRNELDKCDLLCSNCHRRLHSQLKKPSDTL